MATCSLTLHPYGKQPFSVGLSENDGRKGSIEQIITKTTDVCIFSDLSYEFALSCEKQVLFGKSMFTLMMCMSHLYTIMDKYCSRKSTNDRRILWTVMVVEITLVVYDTDGIEHQYSTEYLPVLVRRGELTMR